MINGLACRSLGQGRRRADPGQLGGRHLVLILEFASTEDANRVAQDVGGPWMRRDILQLLARGSERSVGEVVASARVWTGRSTVRVARPARGPLG